MLISNTESHVFAACQIANLILLNCTKIH